MNHPLYEGPYADRIIDCEFAVEGGFLAIMEDAIKAGWTPEEAAFALTTLADNFVLQLHADEDFHLQMLDLLANRKSRQK